MTSPRPLSQRPRPFTPDTLAERWACSAETVRQMVKRGELPGFRVGRLFRIPVNAVEEYEECQTSASDGSGADFASTGPTPAPENDGATALRHAPARKRKPKP
ncbi:excisionase family DNA-binding protein [Mameliella alba]|uniref:excisionase family DNA-binding protein n=1 Tax=Mameliella alba TaxID=561184 RepID=UPI0009E24BA8